MDRYSLRHLMAAIMVADELVVPNTLSSPDPYLNNQAMRARFVQQIVNAYFIADLMFEIGDREDDYEVDLSGGFPGAFPYE